MIQRFRIGVSSVASAEGKNGKPWACGCISEKVKCLYIYRMLSKTKIKSINYKRSFKKSSTNDLSELMYSFQQIDWQNRSQTLSQP